ncbi:MAG: glycosyltransferase family 39 protein [Prevotella sp.]|nr:glycosyltransferase family 39 protein [Prevotella sp.]
MRVNKKSYFFVIVMALVSFFFYNTATPTDIMEVRNLVAAHEMATEGHIMVPRMNGDLRLEKPPLPTWVAGAIDYVYPDNMSAQRVAAGVMGCVWTFFLYLFALRLSRRRYYAVITTVVFLTCYQIVLMGRSATWDIYCHALMMGGIYYLYCGLTSDLGQRWKWFTLAGVMMGLSYMSKGPVSFYALLLPWLIASVADPRVSARGKWDALALMVVLTIVIGGWWYANLYIFHYDAIQAVLAKETGAWANHNTRPWWYYWRFFTETGVWTVVTFASLFAFYWKRNINDARSYLFGVTWMVAALVLLSLMPEKKIRYLLPMMAPCSLCVASIMDHCGVGRDKWSRIVYLVNGYIVAIIPLAVPVALYFFKMYSLTKLLVVMPLFVAIDVWLLISVRRIRPTQFVMAVGAVFMLTELTVLGDIGRLFVNPDRHGIAAVRSMPALNKVAFYHPATEDIRIEMVYEAGRKIRPIDVTSVDSVRRHLPMVLVSQKGVASYMPPAVLATVDTTLIDTYDDNRHPKGNKHYNRAFHNQVTLIKAKTK